MHLSEIDSLEKLPEAVLNIKANEHLWLNLGNQVILFYKKRNDTMLFCDLHGRPPSDAIKQIFDDLAIGLVDVNKAIRLASDQSLSSDVFVSAAPVISSGNRRISPELAIQRVTEYIENASDKTRHDIAELGSSRLNGGVFFNALFATMFGVRNRNRNRNLNRAKEEQETSTFGKENYKSQK